MAGGAPAANGKGEAGPNGVEPLAELANGQIWFECRRLFDPGVSVGLPFKGSASELGAFEVK